LQLDYARNKQGIRYAYYICTGRATKRTSCTRKAVPVGVAEQLVADCYQQIAITEHTYAQLAQRVEAAFDQRLAERSQALDDLATTKQRLEAEADKLLEAHFADAIDLPTLKRHQDRIRIALADVTKRLEAERHDHEGPRQHLATALRLLADCATMYERTDDLGKRLANQAFYQRILITEDEKAAIQLNEPFAALAPTSSDVRCSTTSDLVGLFSSHANELRKAHRSLRDASRHSQGAPAGRVRRKAQRRISDEQAQRITEGYAAGKTVYELAAEFGCHRVTISAVLKRQGVTLRHASPTGQQVDEMVRRYEDGSSLARVGDELGFNASTVLTHLRERGVRTRTR